MSRRWKEAIAAYKLAEQDHVYSTAQSDGAILASRACRGVGYVLVEEKKLDEAEANDDCCCLSLDPNDKKTMNELRYIQQLRRESLTWREFRIAAGTVA